MIEFALCALVSKDLILNKIDEVSKDFNVDKELVTFIVEKESQFNNCAIGDTHLVAPDGKNHISRGLVQINEYYNPNIQARHAYNVSFSLEFLATKIREGKATLWSTYKLWKPYDKT